MHPEYRSSLSQPCVENEDGDVKIFEFGTNDVFVFLNREQLGKVCFNGFGFDLLTKRFCIFLKLSQFRIDFGFISGDDADVETLFGKVSAEAVANAIRATGDNSPAISLLIIQKSLSILRVQKLGPNNLAIQK